MAIRYLVVRPSGYVPRMSKNKATHITALINNAETLRQLKFSARDILGICFEQALLSNYLLDMNPNNLQLQDYRDNCKRALTKQLSNSKLFGEENLKQERISKAEVKMISGYVLQNQYIGSSGLESILSNITSGKEAHFTSVPKQFAYPYMVFQTAHLEGDHAVNPVVLSPVCRIHKETGDQEITFYCRSYTSINCQDPNIHPGKMANKTLAYICAMNHNGRSWKELVDTIQSLRLNKGTRLGSESLSDLLGSYLRFEKRPQLVTDLTGKRKQLLDALRVVMQRDALIIDKENGDVEELVGMFSYLGDNRLKYLLEREPIVAAKESWDTWMDLHFLEPLGASHGYAMAADDDPAKEDQSGDSGTNADDAGNDTTDDISTGTDDEGTGDEDDLFGDGDDFATPDDEGGDSGDDGGSGSSSSDSGSTDTSSGSANTADPEDVNPIIELIDDETFDEYLDRGILQVRIKRLITNPPASLSDSDVEFVKYWYLVWFPCVSVATTREILGKLLILPARKIKPIAND